jgi:hypothetical protein
LAISQQAGLKSDHAHTFQVTDPVTAKVAIVSGTRCAG